MHVSHDSVATQLKCGGTFNNCFIANCPQCLNCEKLAGGWTLRPSEPDHNYDVNRTYIADPQYIIWQCVMGVEKTVGGGFSPPAPPGSSNADCPQYVSVKEFWKLVNIWQR